MDGSEGQRGKHEIQPTSPLQLFLDGTSEIARLKLYLELLQNNEFHTYVHRPMRKLPVWAAQKIDFILYLHNATTCTSDYLNSVKLNTETQILSPPHHNCKACSS